MDTSVDVGRRCGRCGGQVTLRVSTDGGIYTDDLTALMRADPGDRLIIAADCGCPAPRRVALEAAALFDDDLAGDSE